MLPVCGTYDGASGGILLHVINQQLADKDNLAVSYYYFDVFLAGAIALGFYSSPNFSSDDALQLLRKIQNFKFADRVSVPLAAFLPVSSPAAILAFRFHIPSPSNYISSVSSEFKKASSADRAAAAMRTVWLQSISPWTASQQQAQ